MEPINQPSKQKCCQVGMKGKETGQNEVFCGCLGIPFDLAFTIPGTYTLNMRKREAAPDIPTDM